MQAIRRLFPNLPVYGGLAQEERAEMLCAKAPALEALAVELSETADGRRELGRQYASAAAVLSGEEESARQLFNVTRGLALRRTNGCKTRWRERCMAAPSAAFPDWKPLHSARISTLSATALCLNGNSGPA